MVLLVRCTWKWSVLCMFLYVSFGMVGLMGCASTYKMQAASADRHRMEGGKQSRVGFFEHIARLKPAHQGFSVRLPQYFGPFQWPLKTVLITSPFGHRRRTFHEGIDLRAPEGTPVFAAQSGIVLYADDRVKGYGKMIVIRHRDQLATIYAHNSKLLVQRGQQVKQGQRVALSGNSGHSTGPHVHFEVRRGLAAMDPLPVLPRLKYKSRSLVTRKAAAIQVTAFR